MKLKALKITVILLLGISFSGMAQTKQIKLEANPHADKIENVKVERIDNQDVLRVAGPTDTIRIVLSVDNRSTIEKLMQSNVGKGATIKDIDGTDVHLLRVSLNMRPGMYFRNEKKESIYVLDEELKLFLNKN